MTARTKIYSFAALLALVLATGLWLSIRSRSAPPVNQAPLVETTAPAVHAPDAAPAGDTPLVASARPVTPVASQTSAPVFSAVQPSSPSALSSTPPPLTPPDTTAPASPLANPVEEAATARMYAAHAPLRTPEVSDPDSQANKQILGTMVTKLLAQPATPPPAAAAQR